MIRPEELSAIKAGEIDLAFRRWDRPRVRVGTRMRTGVGLIEVTSVDKVALSTITASDARRAGASTLARLKAALAPRSERARHAVYRVGLAYAGADPRDSLRDAMPSSDEIAVVRGWLDRLDAAAAPTIGAWTRPTLILIGRHPGRRAPDLAAELGRETSEFKRDVRKLKEKGLTQSLDIGYRLSARGAAVLGAEAPPQRPLPDGTPLPRVGAPASRALRDAGIDTVEQLADWAVEDVAALHGVGPFALNRLREAAAAVGVDFDASRPADVSGDPGHVGSADAK